MLELVLDGLRTYLVRRLVIRASDECTVLWATKAGEGFLGRQELSAEVYFRLGIRSVFVWEQGLTGRV